MYLLSTLCAKDAGRSWNHQRIKHLYFKNIQQGYISCLIWTNSGIHSILWGEGRRKAGGSEKLGGYVEHLVLGHSVSALFPNPLISWFTQHLLPRTD